MKSRQVLLRIFTRQANIDDDKGQINQFLFELNNGSSSFDR